MHKQWNMHNNIHAHANMCVHKHKDMRTDARAPKLSHIVMHAETDTAP